MSWFSKLFAKKSGPDKRRFERVELPLNVSYSLESDGTMRVALLNRAKNISIGGLCFDLYEPMATGTPFFLNIEVSDSYSVTVRGFVSWQVAHALEDGRTQYETGVRFDGLDEDDRKTLALLIKNRTNDAVKNSCNAESR